MSGSGKTIPMWHTSNGIVLQEEQRDIFPGRHDSLMFICKILGSTEPSKVL